MHGLPFPRRTCPISGCAGSGPRMKISPMRAVPRAIETALHQTPDTSLVVRTALSLVAGRSMLPRRLSAQSFPPTLPPQLPVIRGHLGSSEVSGPDSLTWTSFLVSAIIAGRPRQDSNLRTRLRSPTTVPCRGSRKMQVGDH
jgi:hypothetical protein